MRCGNAADAPEAAQSGFLDRLFGRAKELTTWCGRSLVMLDEAHLLHDWDATGWSWTKPTDSGDVFSAWPLATRWAWSCSSTRGEYLLKGEDQIRGTGYVVESLEAAVWCFNRTGTFKDAILTAVNLGDDADTTAAVCGQVAGAFYGESGIPAGWLEKLVMRGEVGEVGERLRSLPGEMQTGRLV